MLLYYITDRKQFLGNERERTERLLKRIADAAVAEVDFVQLREKDLTAKDLKVLAHAAMERIRASGTKSRLLINSRTDVAIAAGADGVHLRSRDITPEAVRRIWRLAEAKDDPITSVSCHTDSEVVAAKVCGADFAVFAPVFENKDGPRTAAAGLDALRSACSHGFPVLALGGITAENASSCLQTGAAGLGGIRLFQAGDLMSTVKRLRG